MKKDSNEKPTKKRSSSQTTNEMVMFILQTFVDSLPHCPEHRRIHILTNMLRVMGVDDYFHLLLLLLLKKLVHKANKQSEGDIEVLLLLEKLIQCLNFMPKYLFDYSAVSKVANNSIFYGPSLQQYL